MDKPVLKTAWQKQGRRLMFASFVLIASLSFYQLNSNQITGQSQKVALANIVVSQVKLAAFEDSLNLRGVVTPKTSIYLDSVAGGRVEEKLVERGSFVEKGQPLIRLSNASLQLDVISREAQISEQLNFLRNTQMLAETNRLNLSREIIENDNQIAHLNRKIQKVAKLAEKNFYSQDKLAELKQDLSYYQQRKSLNLQRQQQEEQLRSLQLKQLEESALMLKKNLTFARQNLANLLIKAPASGTLSELNVELGESKIVGARLGQIDLPEQFKLLVLLDEFYLNQIQIGMPVFIQVNSESVEAQISKIDSRVNQAQFSIEVDLPSLTNQQKVKRGQSLELSIILSPTNKQSLLIPRGAFSNTSGGHWLFVLDHEQKTATHRQIKLGKKNQLYYQVLSGLSAGESVITSSYNTFKQADRLLLY